MIPLGTRELFVLVSCQSSNHADGGTDAHWQLYSYIEDPKPSRPQHHPPVPLKTKDPRVGFGGEKSNKSSTRVTKMDKSSKAAKEGKEMTISS